MSKVWLVVVVLAGWRANGQGISAPGSNGFKGGNSAVVPADARAGLTDMAGRAAVVFAGHVTRVDQVDGAGYVDVTFKVDEAVKGCGKLGIYVVREWAGLWRDNVNRYRVGERLLMLLSGRGRSGMSAPLDGGTGRIPIVGGGTEPLADAKGVAPAEDGSVAGDVTGMTVDLRWVEAAAVRPGFPDESGLGGGTAGGEWSGPVGMLGGTVGAGTVQPSVATVLTLLRGLAGVTRVAR